jgi:hypothetical protein
MFFVVSCLERLYVLLRRPDFWLPNFDGKMMLVGLARGQQGLFNSHDKEMTSARGPKSVML